MYSRVKSFVTVTGNPHATSGIRSRKPGIRWSANCGDKATAEFLGQVCVRVHKALGCRTCEAGERKVERERGGGGREENKRERERRQWGREGRRTGEMEGDIEEV